MVLGPCERSGFWTSPLHVYLPNLLNLHVSPKIGGYTWGRVLMQISMVYLFVLLIIYLLVTIFLLFKYWCQVMASWKPMALIHNWKVVKNIPWPWDLFLNIYIYIMHIVILHVMRSAFKVANFGFSYGK